MKIDLRINVAQKKMCIFFKKHTFTRTHSAFMCLMWFAKQTTIILIFSITPTNAHIISIKLYYNFGVIININ